MADKSVGTISAKVVANADGFNAGIDTAIKKAENFSNHVGQILSQPLTGATALLAGPGKSVDALLGPLKNALSSIPLVGAAFAAIPLSGAAFFEWLDKGKDKIIEQERLAARLGVTMKEAASFHVLGGGRSEEFEKAIQRMMRSPEAEGKTAVEAYKQITDRIKGMSDATQRAIAINEVFGKGGIAVADILLKGGGGLDAATRAVEKYGLSVTEAQARAIKLEEQIVRGRKLMAEGFQIQMAGRGAENREEGWAILGGGSLEKIRAERAEAAKVGAADEEHEKQAMQTRAQIAEAQKIADSVKTATDSYERQIAAITGAGEAYELLKLKTEGANEQQLQGVKTLADQKEVLDKIMTSAEHAGNAFDNFAVKQAALNDAAAKHKITVQEQADALKKLEGQLNKQAGADAAKFIKEGQNPLDKFREAMQEINRLAEMHDEISGKVLLTEEQKALAIQKQVDLLEQSNKRQAESSVPSLTYGTAGFDKAVTDYRMNDSKNLAEMMKQAEQDRKQQIEHARKTAEMVEKLVEKFDNIQENSIP